MFLDQIGGKTVVTCRHGSVRGEHDFTRDASGRAVKIQALVLHAMSNGLQNRKDAMPLIQVQDSGSEPHRTQSTISPHAQQQFLTDSRTPVSTVEPRGQLAVLGSISFDIGIEKKKIAAADFDAPDFYADGAAERLDIDRRCFALASDGRLHRQLIDVGRKVFFPLPAISIQALAKIALAIKQPNAGQGNA